MSAKIEPKGNPVWSHSNTSKMKNNLLYCYSCSYDVNYKGWKFHLTNRKRTHLPNVSKYEAHTVAGASIKAQHTNLPNGLGAGKGWIIAKQLQK